ncbi:MAG: ABC transporter permease [Oscillospiraceae bacterium]|nr:ABC transporter permease [Oscillospiraceae bacterium]
MGFHIVKRDNCPLWKRGCFYLIAVLAALLVGAVVLLSIGVNPIEYYYQMFTLGTVGNSIAYKTFMNYIDEFLPLALTSVALSLAFKMRFWNIGGEGQFIIGSITASYIALQFGPSLPQGVTLLLMCIVAMASAGLYGLLVAFLKVKFGTNETLLTLMMNYIALYLLYFIGETKADWNIFLQEQSARPVFESFAGFAKFPYIPIAGGFRLNICLILTLLIGGLVYVYLRYTKHGYEINVVGDSSGTARYAGMKVNKVVLRTVFISAALIGLAGAFKVGSAGVLSTAITDDVGWTGIIVAWLAQLNTISIFIVSALICILQYGCTVAAATFSQVDSSFANMLQGAILFLVLVADFFIRFRIARKKKGESVNG